MHLQKENPTLAARGVPKTDHCFAGWITSEEDSRSTHSLQVASLTRRCAVSTGMASVVASLLYGEGSQ